MSTIKTRRMRLIDTLDIGVISVSHSFSDGYTSLLAPVLALIVLDFGLSEFQVGILLSTSTFATFLMVFPSSLAADLSGRRVEILVSGLGIASLAYLSMAAADSFWILIVLVFLARGGNSVFHPCGTALVSARFSKMRPLAISLFALAGNIGTGLIPLLQGLIAESNGWRLSIAVFTLPFSVLIPLLMYRYRRLPDFSKIEGNKSTLRGKIGEIVAAVFRDRSVTVLGIVYALGGTASKASIGFIPLLAAQKFGMNSAAIGLLMSIYFGMGIASKPLMVMMYGRYGLRHSIRMPLLISFIATLSMIAVQDMALLFVLTGIVGLSNPISPIILASTADKSHPGILTTSIGLIYSMHAVGFVGPLAGGVLAQHFDLSATYVMAAGVFFVAFAVTMTLPSANRSESQRK